MLKSIQAIHWTLKHLTIQDKDSVKMTKMVSISTLLLLQLVVFNVSSHPLSHQKHGRCAGSAVNYFVSVPTFRECHKACENDERCCHYSYHASEEGGHHCFLYNTEQCDINNLLTDAAHDHWRTGWMAGCAVQNIFTRARKTIIRMWAAEANHPAWQSHTCYSWWSFSGGMKCNKKVRE